ncbi:unnamed protein product [Lepeophtheirus salmonis]|uniref:(salmon louse) hypothetical protein n=1 Tax=Lepeophtheirus salmonis TaxID=72036 RepID=A0A7R8H757_LEPSM|nr:unnamed protein product [Lepeophtheirus salmonis]CAF2916757.1 unnamed protein product [Lepeophtheirus salmonis]
MVHCQVNRANTGCITEECRQEDPSLFQLLGTQSWGRLKCVVTEVGQPILGLRSCLGLGLVKHNGAVHQADGSLSTNADIQALLDEFSNLFDDAPGANCIPFQGSCPY